MGNEIQRDAALVRKKLGEHSFDFAVILGSGLSASADTFDHPVSLDYIELKSAPATTIPGHSGTLTACHLDDLRILVFQGRFHCYQGLSAFDAAWPVRLSAALGVTHLLATSAVGSISPDLSPGDFVFIRDHINLLGDNPLRGLTPPVFIDLVGLYQPHLYAPFKRLFSAQGSSLHRGVLAAMSGPSYETPAEIEMLGRLGADVVSMSMVPEAIMARSLGIKMVGLALVSNLAAGLAAKELTHHEVVAAGKEGGRRLAVMLPDLIRSCFSC